MMKKIFFVICFLVSTNGFSADIYFDTESFPHPAKTELLKAARGEIKLSADSTKALITAYSESDIYTKIIQEYTSQLFKLMNVDRMEPDLWRAANPAIAKGILNYVGASDESMADPDPDAPSWMTINAKLRSREKFTEREQVFFDEINFALKQIPQAKGLVFRGHKLSVEQYEAIIAGKPWHQRAFTSTSLNYWTAFGFGRGYEGSTKTGILILQVNAGVPVSPLTFDSGFQGQPGRIDEHEILLPAGQTLCVHSKIDDQANSTYYIYGRQMSPGETCSAAPSAK
jgi:hypothetical protein